MKNITCLSSLMFLSTLLISQSLELQSSSDFSSQIKLLSANGIEHFDIRMKDDGILSFIANGFSEAMQIDDDSGKVGIGVVAVPSSQLYVRNAETTNAARNAIHGFAAGSGSTWSRYGVYGLATGDGIQAGVYGSAVPGAGTGSWGVYCNGNMWYTGSLTSISDGRLKTNIQGIEETLTKVMKMKPRSYNYKQKGIPLSQDPQIGFVAQELEAIFPQLVETNMHDIHALPGEDSGEQIEIKGINYIGLIPVLTKAIQEQQEIIDDHRLKLETQQSQIALLISQNDRK